MCTRKTFQSILFTMVLMVFLALIYRIFYQIIKNYAFVMGFKTKINTWISKHCSCKIRKKIVFFSIWVFFHVHSRFTGQQGKGEAICLTPLYHFLPLHRHLDISQVITAESSLLHIASSRTRTGNFWFPSTGRYH